MPLPGNHRERSWRGSSRSRAILAEIASAVGALAAFVPLGWAQEAPGAVRSDQRSIPVNFTKPEGRPATPAAEERVGPPRVEEHPGTAAVETAKGPDRIWCGLFLASNGEKLKAPDASQARIAKKIEKFFGYKQIELVGLDKAVDDRLEHWLVPSQDIWLSVRSHREPDGLYLLDLRIFHDRRRVIDTKAKLGQDSPLLIRGPMCSRGQLVIALQILP